MAPQPISICTIIFADLYSDLYLIYVNAQRGTRPELSSAKNKKKIATSSQGLTSLNTRIEGGGAGCQILNSVEHFLFHPRFTVAFHEEKHVALAKVVVNHTHRCCVYGSLRQKQRQLEGLAIGKKHLDSNSRSNSQACESEGNSVDARKRTPPLSPSVGKVATPIGGGDSERSSPSAADFMVMLRRPGTPLLTSVVDLKKAVHAATRAWLRDFKIRGGRSVSLPTIPVY